jgi:hypothetical protein
MSDFSGRPSYEGPQALATNGRVADAVVRLLAMK